VVTSHALSFTNRSPALLPPDRVRRRGATCSVSRVERIDFQENAVEIQFRTDGLTSLVEDFKSAKEAA
jgi:hypothetical protein